MVNPTIKIRIVVEQKDLIKEMLTVLKEVEILTDEHHYCEMCGEHIGLDYPGHAPDCKLAAMITKAEKMLG